MDSITTLPTDKTPLNSQEEQIVGSLFKRKINTGNIKMAVILGSIATLMMLPILDTLIEKLIVLSPYANSLIKGLIFTIICYVCLVFLK